MSRAEVSSTQIALIATMRDELVAVEEWWEGIHAQSLRPVEIVVVDGGSSDGTLETLRLLEKEFPQLRVHSHPRANIAAGRNLAISLVTAPVVAVTDAGTIADPDWLEELAVALDDHTDVVSGFFRPAGRGIVERTIAAATVPLESEIDPATFLPSSRSIAFRRSAWERVGGYPEDLEVCEDVVFDLRLRASGAVFRFAPGAQVTWSARPTVRAFFNQYRSYARGDAVAGLFRRRHAMRFGAYAGGLGALLAALRGVRTPLTVSSLLGAAYLAKFWRRVWRHDVGFNPRAKVAATVLTPVIVAAGDTAKMVGYLQGLRERVPS